MKKIFAALAGKVRRLAAGFVEKDEMKVDDFEMEHFLLYNGLIGSTPENQREYREVRNDIVQAVNDGSAHQLAIALKLPPLWWEARLEKTFGDIAAINRPGLISCLMAARPLDDFTGDTTPLSHSDWRVRSNAARMLAFLDAKEAVPRLCELLNECQDKHKPAFCHIAYSLAELGTEQSRQSLLPYLESKEAWYGVDAAGALALFHLPSVAHDLMKAMLSENEMDDYMAVAIARRHRPLEIAEFKDEEVQEGFAELVMALLKAANGAFHAEQFLHQSLEESAERINELALEKPTPRRIAAAVTLNRWLEKGSASQNGLKIQNPIRDLSNPAHYESVKSTVSQKSQNAASGQLKHALALASQFRLSELSQQILPLIKADAPALPEVISCAAALGAVDAAPAIVGIINDKVNLEARCRLPLSAHPVFETDKEISDLYWTALKGLGSLTHPSSLELLEKAVRDHAPDKREQAVLSLQTLLLSEEMKNLYTGDLQNLIKELTKDPSVAVQAAALNGIAQHKLSELIPDTIKSLLSGEAVLHRRASETLIHLSSAGCRKEVKQCLENSLSKELDSGRQHRLNKLLQRI